MLQLNHLMLKSNSLEQTSEGLQTRNFFSSGYQSYMHNHHLFPTEPCLPVVGGQCALIVRIVSGGDI